LEFPLTLQALLERSFERVLEADRPQFDISGAPGFRPGDKAAI
jgi:hypothetical protein